MSYHCNRRRRRVDSITGYTCKRGEEYGKQEFAHPVRILTSTVKLEGADQPLLPVRSEKPVPKELLADCMKVLKAVDVKAPVKRYDVIVENICGAVSISWHLTASARKNI